jgi:hypothetical protein
LSRMSYLNVTYPNQIEPAPGDDLSGKKIVQVACGYYHTIFLDDNGNVYSCGLNSVGQLGYTNDGGVETPRKITPGTGDDLLDKTIVQVACGWYHTIFLDDNGNVYSCGENNNGQLGYTNDGNVETPRKITPATGDDLIGKTIVQVVCGYYHTIFLDDNGNVYSCGYNDNGQLGYTNDNIFNTNVFTPKQIEPAPGDDLSGKKIVQVACGSYHTIFLDDNGNVYSCGLNISGQLGYTNDGNVETPRKITPETRDDLYGKTIVQVACGNYYTIFISDIGDGGGGGGGGGEVVHIPLYVLESGIYNISVGQHGGLSGIKSESDTIIFQAREGGNGGDFDNNGVSGGSGGGAGGSPDGTKKLGGNEGATEEKISYQNKAGYTKTANGSGGGGAGEYSNNIGTGVGESSVNNGGNGISINIRNDNAVYGKGGDGGNYSSGGTVGIDGIDGTGNGGRGGDTGQNGGSGSSGIVIIRVKEGYSVDHSSLNVDPGLILHKIVSEKNGTLETVSHFKSSTTSDLQRHTYYGFFKYTATDILHFKIFGHVDNIASFEFKLGFESDVLYLQNLDGTVDEETIYIKSGVYYPLYFTCTNISTTLMNADIKYKRNGGTWQGLDNLGGTNFLYHLQTFPGTTSMSI